MRCIVPSSSDLRRQMLYGFITTVYDMIALPAGE